MKVGQARTSTLEQVAGDCHVWTAPFLQELIW